MFSLFVAKLCRHHQCYNEAQGGDRTQLSVCVSSGRSQVWSCTSIEIVWTCQCCLPLHWMWVAILFLKTVLYCWETCIGTLIHSISILLNFMHTKRTGNFLLYISCSHVQWDVWWDFHLPCPCISLFIMFMRLYSKYSHHPLTTVYLSLWYVRTAPINHYSLSLTTLY